MYHKVQSYSDSNAQHSKLTWKEIKFRIGLYQRSDAKKRARDIAELPQRGSNENLAGVKLRTLIFRGEKEYSPGPEWKSRASVSQSFSSVELELKNLFVFVRDSTRGEKSRFQCSSPCTQLGIYRYRRRRRRRIVRDASKCSASVR